MSDKSPVRILVWSDYVCPFCYLEVPVLARIQREFGARVELEWKAFELRPEPAPTLDPNGPYLQTVWRRAVYPMAAQREMTLHLPPVQPRSRSALEAAEHARERDRFEPMHHGIFRAFFEEGRDIGDVRVLLEVGESVGIDPSELERALREGRHSGKVLADQRLAHDIGVTSVPTLLIAPPDAPLEESEVISGAHAYEVVRAALERVLRRDPAGRIVRRPVRRGLTVLGD